jgi:hypothetical protein
MAHADAFHRPPTVPLLVDADATEARMLQRFHRWNHFISAVKDASRRDDFSARLDIALRNRQR